MRVGAISAAIPLLALVLVHAFAFSSIAAAEDFGQLGTCRVFSPNALWLSEAGDSYVQKALTSRPRGDGPIEVVRYRFRLSKDEANRISAFLKRSGIWHPRCQTQWYDNDTMAIWQHRNAVTKTTCESFSPIRPTPNFGAFLKLLDSIDGGQGPAIEVYRGLDDMSWTPPGFEKVSCPSAEIPAENR